MKTIHNLKYFIGLITLIGLLNACVNDNTDYQTPQINCEEPAVTVTNTLAELHDNVSNVIHQINENIVVEGYVISSDEQGNFYATVSIQNLEGTAGIRLSIDRKSIYTTLGVGQKVYLKAQNLYIDNSNGDADVALGILSNGGIGRLPDVEANNFIFRSCDAIDENQLVHPATIATLNDSQLNTLVEFENVQFRSDEIGGNYFDPNNVVGAATNRHIIDENGHELIVRNSQYSTFSNDPLPDGNGKISGVLSKFNGDYQLVIRDTNDVKFTNPRQTWGFATHIEGPLTPIASLRSLFKNGNSTITFNGVIEGVVTMSTQSGNLSKQNAFIQDDSGGIALRFDSIAHNLYEGYKVRINVKNLKLYGYAGLLELSNIIQASRVQLLGLNAPMPPPKSTSLDELMSGAHQGEIVKIDNVQFTQTLVSYSGTRQITDCNEIVPTYTSYYANFSRDMAPFGNGTLIGVASAYKGIQILLRNSNGTMAMTGTRCGQAELLFSENFESLKKTGDSVAVVLPGWVNVDAYGNSELWEARKYSSNTYAQASVYGVTGAMNTWLITPVIDLSGKTDTYLTFNYAQNYYNGDVLKVLISTDYDGNTTAPQDATWADVTNEANLIDNNAFGYMSTFSLSHKIDLSAYSGKINIAFLYNASSDGASTTVQIDNIQLYGK